MPKGERSRFVEKAIDQALRATAMNRLKKMLDELPRNSGVGVQGESTTDFLRAQRMKWDGRPLDVLEGSKE
ncbi:hypothetical protein [Mesorhizobium australafricanum]|uniref:Uncharacterized protein n=1 Tax=Mesorhizobium australafricanum TaxID=3072311 RepID=A0ABU4X0K1_9HYPH|nr:hypothetical protein [Mesorhizobium sp. VK3E]MDX8441544.1 hypothetical protein [Mesorhizobium sp. VK3E]